MSYGIIAVMTEHRGRVLARPDEELHSVLFHADRRMWKELSKVARARGTSRSAMVRAMIRREVQRARTAGEIA
jgi:metal-responsive CopG/Arc/MetJ family transcriptional regulator